MWKWCHWHRIRQHPGRISIILIAVSSTAILGLYKNRINSSNNEVQYVVIMRAMQSASDIVGCIVWAWSHIVGDM